jgi:lipopolysaccharide export system protein LptA
VVTAQGSDAQRTLERRHAISPTASIRLTAVSQETEVRVIGWERDSLVFSGTVGAGARVDGGVGANGAGAKWFVETPQGSAAAPARLELRVPSRSRVWVKLGSGEVEVTGMRGAIDVNIVSGSVTITGDLRELNAEAMDGAITVNGRAEWMRAKTAGGMITISGGGQDVGLTSVSGDVVMHGAALARARIETVTGDVLAAVGLERGGQLTIDSHSGRVELRLPPKQGSDIDVVTVNGSVTNNLTAARPIPGMGARGQELGTSIAGGGRSITIRTFKGPVLLLADTATAAAVRP